MKKQFLLFIIIFAACINAYCQVSGPNGSLPNYDPPSPEASALGKYVDQPVGYFTGTPKIDLPLFEIKTGRITIPISVSYHGSGIKVNDIASRVGSGWVLNAGGVITRTVKGFPDDGGTDMIVPDGENVVPYFQGGNISSNSTTYANNGSSTPITQYDLEPDEYFYNFGSHMGKMYFADQTTPVLCNDDPLKVSGPFNGNNSFTITDEKGIVYTFQSAENTRVINASSVSYAYTSSWFITQIYDPVNNKTVTFQYNTNIPQLNFSYTKSLSASPPCGSSGLYNTSQVFVEQSQVLTKIIYDNGYIEFDANLNRQDLTGDVAFTKISEYANNGSGSSLLKGYTLAYSNTSTGSGVQEGYRLYLNSLQEFGSDGIQLPPYSFYYKNANTLPDRNSEQQDIWGYYNANGAATTTFPQYPKVFIHNNGTQTDYLPFDNLSNPATQTLSGVDCSSNAATVDAGTISKIVYPTQGYTTYAFESNNFGPALTPYVGGGIRIKEIDNFSASGQLLLYKTYQYDSGFLGGPYPQVAYPAGSYGVLRFSLNQTVLGSSQGNYVGYGQVTETQNGTDGTNNGSIIYTYTTTPDVPGVFSTIVNSCFSDLSSIQTESYFPFFEMESKEEQRGVLTQQIYYDPSGNPRKSVYYNYQLVSNPLIKVYSSYITFGIGNPPGQVVVNLNQTRMINAEKILLTSKTESEYDGPVPTALQAPSISRNTYYTYCGGSHGDQFLRSETQNNSGSIQTNNNGDRNQGIVPDNIAQATYKYPFDYSTTASGGIMAQMVAMNYISTPINTIKSITNNSNSNSIDYYTDATLVDYMQNPLLVGSSQVNAIVPKQVYQLNPSVPLQNNTPSVDVADPSNPGSFFESRLQFLYDGNGNVAQVTQSGPETNAYQWGYNKSYLVAKATNAKSNDIFYDSFEEGDGNSVVGDAKTGSYSFIGTYLKPLIGLDIGNYVLSYWQKTAGVWSFQTSIVQVSNSNYEITIGNSGAQIDDVRLYPVNSQMTTYTYAVPFGITSSTDAKGEITYYEYDSFQRLHNIKDKNGNIVKSFVYNYAGQATSAPLINITLSNSTGSTVYQAVFTSTTSSTNLTFNFPTTGNSVISVPADTYEVEIYPSTDGSDSVNHTITLTGQTSVVAPRTTFNNVVVAFGSNLAISIY